MGSCAAGLPSLPLCAQHAYNYVWVGLLFAAHQHDAEDRTKRREVAERVHDGRLWRVARGGAARARGGNPSAFLALTSGRGQPKHPSALPVPLGSPAALANSCSFTSLAPIQDSSLLLLPSVRRRAAIPGANHKAAAGARLTGSRGGPTTPRRRCRRRPAATTTTGSAPLSPRPPHRATRSCSGTGSFRSSPKNMHVPERTLATFTGTPPLAASTALTSPGPMGPPALRGGSRAGRGGGDGRAGVGGVRERGRGRACGRGRSGPLHGRETLFCSSP